MIPRYSLPEMAELFSDESRFGAWLDVEILATEAWAEIGVVPAE
ncbi:MAG: adenylosuccinate lyase, partial [Acidimicrobiia bacterium]|nr:adenylosuccinate lyase [Acidimicrobiia bacterium]